MVREMVCLSGSREELTKQYYRCGDEEHEEMVVAEEGCPSC